jgi:hypothetical protein
LPTLPERFAAGYAFWSGAVDASCAAANPGAEPRCYLTEAYPYLGTPLFVAIAEQDEKQLNSLGVTWPLDTGESAYVDTFINVIKSTLQPLPAAFAPNVLDHGLAADRSFWMIRIANLSLRDLFGNWYFNRPGPVKLIR